MAKTKRWTIRVTRVQEEQAKRCMEKLQLDKSAVIRYALSRLCESEGIKISTEKHHPRGHE